MDSYCEAILHRLSQTDIPHSLVQIAMDGSQKLPHRIFVSLQRAYHQGLPRRALLVTLASWIKYLETNLPVNDPLSDELIKIKEKNPEQFFKNLMNHKLFEGLRQNPSFTQELTAAYESF
jgi:mannitol-1-phosphate/altronate dehydrogenase